MTKTTRQIRFGRRSAGIPAVRAHMALWVAALAAVAFLPAFGRTVAYWPLAYENCVRTTTGTVFANQGEGGELNAVPSSNIGAITGGNDYAPIGTNAFPIGYGVYDPISGTNIAAATGLFFHRWNGLNGPAGALRVADPVALRLKTFTVECFIRWDETSSGSWNCIAVMPRQLKSGNTFIKNCDSWGLRITDLNKLKIRFTKSGYGINGDVISGSKNVDKDFTVPSLNDHRWHHVAFSVNDETHKLNAFFDYTWLGELNIGESVGYRSGEDLYIGNTPQTPGPYGGSIAHFRISDEVLEPTHFLHFTRTERAADVADDVLLQMDFEPVDGLPAEFPFFNDAAIGPAVHRYGARKLPAAIADQPQFSPVYSSLLDAAGRPNDCCMTNGPIELSGGGNSVDYLAWTPPEDLFTNRSFTVECCYKTSSDSLEYTPVIRRVGGENVQFNLGFNGGGNIGKIAAGIGQIKADGAYNYTAPLDNRRTDDGRWHHVAAVYDHESGRVWIFRDYESVASTGYSGICAATDKPITIGGGYDGKYQNIYKHYFGKMDNVRITMRALKVGEFLRPDHVAQPVGKTLAWASFDNTLAPVSPAWALTNGTASVAKTGGSAPAYSVFSDGNSTVIEDGVGNSLRTGNLAALSFSTGVVKYVDNLMLPLYRDQTIEFRIKAGAQTPSANIVRCNLARDSAAEPVWMLGFDGSTGRKLMIRCTSQNDGSYGNPIHDDTDIELQDNKWHHIALTLAHSGEGANTRLTASIYKDYEDSPSWTKTVNGSIYYGAGYASLWVGASASDTSFFNGQIDELRISRGVLAPSEFLRHRRNGCLIIFK